MEKKGKVRGRGHPDSKIETWQALRIMHLIDEKSRDPHHYHWYHQDFVSFAATEGWNVISIDF